MPDNTPSRVRTVIDSVKAPEGRTHFILETLFRFSSDAQRLAFIEYLGEEGIPEGTVGVSIYTTPPETLTSPGEPGQVAADAEFFYVYTGDGETHQWRKSPLGESTSELRDRLAVQERDVTTMLAFRRLYEGSNLRVLILGDSIAFDPLAGDGFGVLRLMQDRIGNAGAGGVNVGAEQIYYMDGGTSNQTTGWFREYRRVPAGGALEFALAAPSRGRRYADTAKVAWRAPVGGTATFKIQTCANVDGSGGETWVDHGGTRTAVASGGSEEVGYATISLTADVYRLRVLGVSGDVDVFNMELSHSTMGGVVIVNHAWSGSQMGSWAEMSALRREQFMDACDPDVIMVAYKDSAEIMTTSLAALLETLGDSLSEDTYPRDVVLLAPFASLPIDGANWVANYAQRDVMRQWAVANRQTYVDWWDLGPIDSVYLSDNTHLTGTEEIAYMAWATLDRLGWARAPRVLDRSAPVVRQATLGAYVLLADSTSFAEQTAFRIPLGVGTWRLTGRFEFINDGSAGEGGKIQIDHTSGGALMRNVSYDKNEVNAAPIRLMSPYYGGALSWPLVLSGMTSASTAYGYTLNALDLLVYNPGFLTVSAAKDATGGAVSLREGSFIRAEKLGGV